MLDRQACERRVYRLATLLTGNPIAAAKVIAQVVDAQPDLSRLDSAHMDRLAVLRSREIAPATIVDDRMPPAIADALSKLNPQQREAWVFHHVYRVPDREVARAMDCSVTAMQRHLAMADDVMSAKLGETQASASAMVLSYSMSLDVPAFYRRERRRKLHARAAIIMVALMALALFLAWLALIWGRPMEGAAG